MNVQEQLGQESVLFAMENEKRSHFGHNRRAVQYRGTVLAAVMSNVVAALWCADVNSSSNSSRHLLLLLLHHLL